MEQNPPTWIYKNHILWPLAFMSISWTARLRSSVGDSYIGAKPTDTDDLSEGANSFCLIGAVDLLKEEAVCSDDKRKKQGNHDLGAIPNMERIRER